MSPDPKIGARSAQLQIAQHDLVEERRQTWIAQTNFATIRIELEAERRFQQCEWRCARPGLRCASDRIERRPAPLLAPETAKQFRQPAQVHVSRGFKQRLEPLLNRMFEPVARE